MISSLILLTIYSNGMIVFQISIFFKVSLKRGFDWSNSGGFFWTSAINFSAVSSAILNARALKIKMDSDWPSVFYHSTAGRKKNILKVIPMISFLYIVIIVIMVCYSFIFRTIFRTISLLLSL